jgi:Virulence-associated protein E
MESLGFFGASTNEDNYLRDATGNRRFWPVSVDKPNRIDLAAVERDRDQLWAEAAMFEAGGEALEIGEEHWSAAAIEQRARQEHDPWEDIITAWLMEDCNWNAAKDGWFARCASDDGGFEFRISSAWLLGEVLGIAKDRQGDATSKRLSKVMRSLGWFKPTTTIRIGGGSAGVVRGFVKADDAG